MTQATKNHVQKVRIARFHAAEYARLCGITLQTLRYTYDPKAVEARRRLRRVLSALLVPPGAQKLGIAPPYKPTGRPKCPIRHGTHAGYSRCRERKGRPCRECSTGEAVYAREYRKLKAKLRYERDLAKWTDALIATRSNFKITH